VIRSVCIGVMLLIPGLALAQPHRDHDANWPCQQIKVPSLSLAAVWSGPAVDLDKSHWKDDQAVADLVAKVAPRRVPIDHAQALIDDFAAHAGDKKQPQLLELVAGLFTALDTERSDVIAGLDRFGGRQKELAVQIRADNEKLRAMQDAPSPDADAVQKMTHQVTWEVEVFQDRSRALSYACDVPGKIEQRLFALARGIQKQIE
jgi:hypothetical protein